MLRDSHPSFLSSIHAPGGFRSIESPGESDEGQEVFNRLMVTRARLTAVFSLLIAITQFVGVGTVTSGSPGPATAEYYCCCPGECHCTADCCNHAPTNADHGESHAQTMGAGAQILEAPVRCGVWSGTLSRSPESPKALAANLKGQFPAQSDRSFRQRGDFGSAVSSRGTLRPSTPRAPPVSVQVF